ncbi:hypothetical protein [Thiomicrorhabdus sp.]|uniref:hypothetical protein n=1 Tax=Thiomicrorhabdus sp. TaxID=2039724 RepID=UPI0029C95A0F|nr:hypothetical protein [Thiomicrorhabdus sp.]
MSRTIPVMLSLLLISSCSSSIEKNIHADSIATPTSIDCKNIKVIRNLHSAKIEGSVIGSINAEDSGFSMKCNQSYVLNLFKNEACKAGANVVSVTEERHPDFWSSCYRAHADLIHVDNSNVIAIDTEEYVLNEDNEDTCSEDALAASLFAGVIGYAIAINSCKPVETTKTKNMDSPDQGQLKSE